MPFQVIGNNIYVGISKHHYHYQCHLSRELGIFKTDFAIRGTVKNIRVQERSGDRRIEEIT